MTVGGNRIEGAPALGPELLSSVPNVAVWIRYHWANGSTSISTEKEKRSQRLRNHNVAHQRHRCAQANRWALHRSDDGLGQVKERPQQPRASVDGFASRIGVVTGGPHQAKVPTGGERASGGAQYDRADAIVIGELFEHRSQLGLQLIAKAIQQFWANQRYLADALAERAYG
jgi:hypothetical protein